MRRSRSVALVVAGMVLGTMLLTPVGAHVSQNVGHNWGHYRPLAKKLFYTKAQTDARFARACLPGTKDVACVDVVSGGMMVLAGETKFGSINESGGGGTDEFVEVGLAAPFDVRVTNFTAFAGAPPESPVNVSLRVNGTDSAVGCTIPVIPNVFGCSSFANVVVPDGTLLSVSGVHGDPFGHRLNWSMTLERV